MLSEKGIVSSVTLNWEAAVFVQFSSDISDLISILSSWENFKISSIRLLKFSSITSLCISSAKFLSTHGKL